MKTLTNYIDRLFIRSYLYYLKKRKKCLIKKNHPKIDQIKQKIKKYESYLTEESISLDDNTILKIDELCMHFGGLKAVDKLSFNVKKGEIFGLIGPNGAGKTTVFNCITQFYKATSGQVWYKDKEKNINLKKVKVHKIINHGIVRTFQNVELIWELSVLDNMLVALHTQYRSSLLVQMLYLPKLKREEKQMREKAINVLTVLGLIQYKDFFPLGLPYGVLKRIELARTLMTNPRLIILDEPAAGLNEKETEELAHTIKNIRDQYNCTIFLVEHDMGLVMDICDTVCAISFGRLLAMGTPIEVQNSKTVQEAYLGGVIDE